MKHCTWASARNVCNAITPTKTDYGWCHEHPIKLVALLLVVVSIQALSTRIRYKAVYTSCALHAAGGATGRSSIGRSQQLRHWFGDSIWRTIKCPESQPKGAVGSFDSARYISASRVVKTSLAPKIACPSCR